MNGSIRLGNKRAGSDYRPEVGEVIVNIDRPNPLGNPFSIGGKWQRTRREVIDMFRERLEQQMGWCNGELYEGVCEIVRHLRAGHDVILMCWCRPLPCHGDVIKETAEQLLKI